MTTNLFKEIDFSEFLEKNPDLERFVKEAAKQIANDEVDNLRRLKKPIFDEQLQNHLIGNLCILCSYWHPQVR